MALGRGGEKKFYDVCRWLRAGDGGGQRVWAGMFSTTARKNFGSILDKQNLSRVGQKDTR
jgi:hypothetical protein